MEALKYIEKTRDYLDYLEEHIKNVKRAWCELQDKCKDMRFISDDFFYHWIDKEVEHHDITKLWHEEFIGYRSKFFPVDNKEKQGGFDCAWDHHKHWNPHHWETWTTRSFFNPNEWEIHCVHMVIDWMSMGYKFGDNAKEYYENNKDKITLPEYAEHFIHDIFERLYC